MLAAALVVNLAVLIPICSALLRGSAGMDKVYGPDQPAQRILTALYMSICVASAALLAALAFGAPVIGAIACLLTLQIVYKLMTGPMVGVQNVVVRWNLGIAAFHTAALASLLL